MDCDQFMLRHRLPLVNGHEYSRNDFDPFVSHLLSLGSLAKTADGGRLLQSDAFTSVATATVSCKLSTPWPQLSGTIITSPEKRVRTKKRINIDKPKEREGHR